MKTRVMVAVAALGLALVAGQGWADMGKLAPALNAAAGSKAETHNAEGVSITISGISTWR
jgi:UPF0716 family protein affecting phage T7 exclusion